MKSYQNNKKKYRTARKAGRIAKMPSSLATITHPEYVNALTFNQSEPKVNCSTAYLQAIKPEADVSVDVLRNMTPRIDGDTLFIGNYPAVEIDFRDMRTDQSVSHVNIHMLTAVYSVLLQDWINNEDDETCSPTDHSVDIYIPDFMEFVSGIRNYNKSQVQAVLNSLYDFHGMIGVIYDNNGYDIHLNRYVLLNIHFIKDSSNTIRVSSPYINELINKLLKKRNVRYKRSGKIKYKGNKPVEIPNYSYLIKGSIATARSLRAAEIVKVVVILIEQCGKKGIPHAKVKTIIDRCPYLKIALDDYRTTGDKNKLLARTFSAAWDYLVRYTFLFEDAVPKVSGYIPTIKDLDTTLHFVIRGRNDDQGKACIIITPKRPRDFELSP